MKKNLQFLFEHKTLTKEKAKEVLVNIGKGMYNEHEVTAFMTVYPLPLCLQHQSYSLQ